MSWLFSQALVAEYSQENCWDGEPCAQLNVMPTPQPFSRNDKTMEVLSPSPFGLTLRLLTDDLGKALLTWFLAGFPARISRPPGKGPGSKESEADSGQKWQGSFAKFDPASSSWKTHQYSLLGDLEPYSETWPRWGTMRNGECWERQTWERRTNGTGSGLLPTPLASIGTHGGPNQRDSSGRPGLHMAAMMWPTPNVPNGGRSVAHVTDWRGRTAYHNGKKVQVGLEAAVKLWPTPTVHGNHNRKGASENSGDGLATAVKMWPTPTAVTDTGGAALCKWGGSGARAKLKTMVTPEELNGALNPTWVEWLMGWPIGWTGCEHLETDKCPSALPRHSEGF